MQRVLDLVRADEDGQNIYTIAFSTSDRASVGVRLEATPLLGIEASTRALASRDA